MTTLNLEGEFGVVKEDLARLRADVANLSAALKGATSGAVHEQMESLRSRLDNLTGEARVQGRQALDDLTDRIEDRPLASVLIAFGIGMLIGRLLDR